MSIFDLSKHLMYDWYYSHLKVQYRDRAELLSRDTKSLVLEVQTEDVYAEIAGSADQYDASNYAKDHQLYRRANKKVLGKMKDECTGMPIAEFVRLRPKMYSTCTAASAEERKAKG